MVHPLFLDESHLASTGSHLYRQIHRPGRLPHASGSLAVLSHRAGPVLPSGSQLAGTFGPRRMRVSVCAGADTGNNEQLNKKSAAASMMTSLNLIFFDSLYGVINSCALK